MTAAVDYEVRRYRGDREMTELLSLRHDVFCVEQGVPVYEELDGRDGEGVHLVAVSNGTLLATWYDERPRVAASCQPSSRTRTMTADAIFMAGPPGRWHRWWWPTA